MPATVLQPPGVRSQAPGEGEKLAAPRSRRSAFGDQPEPPAPILHATAGGGRGAGEGPTGLGGSGNRVGFPRNIAVSKVVGRHSPRSKVAQIRRCRFL